MKKHFLRVLTVLLLACLGAFVFTACGGDEETPGGNENPSEPATYTVTYDGNGGTGSVAGGSYAEGATVTVASGEGFSKEDYNFDGWLLDGTTTEYAPGDTFTMPAHNVVLKAQWAPVEGPGGGDEPGPGEDTQTYYSVTYFLGDHAAEEAVVPTQDDVSADDAEITLPAAPAAEDGWEFDGWYVGTEKVGDANGTYTVTDDVTITAHWTDATPAPGPGGDEPAATVEGKWTTTTTKGYFGGGDGATDEITVLIKLGTPNYIAIIGCESEDDTEMYFANAFAVTEAEGVYSCERLSFTLNDDDHLVLTINVGLPEDDPIEFATYAALPAEIDVPTGTLYGGGDGDAYEFNFTESKVVKGTGEYPFTVVKVGDALVLVVENEENIVLFQEDDTYVTYLGVRVELSATAPTPSTTKHTVEYQLNGGEFEGSVDAIAGGSYAEGETVTITDKVPTYTGYTFEGWTIGADEDTVYKYNDAEHGSFLMGDSDVMLTAKWTPITYNVSYEDGKPAEAEGEVEGMPTEPSSVTMDDFFFSLPDEEPTLDGYTFDGWLLNGVKKEGPAMSVSDIIPEEGTDIVFTASWTKKVAKSSFTGKWTSTVSEMTMTVEIKENEDSTSATIVYCMEGYGMTTIMGWVVDRTDDKYEISSAELTFTLTDDGKLNVNQEGKDYKFDYADLPADLSPKSGIWTGTDTEDSEAAYEFDFGAKTVKKNDEPKSATMYVVGDYIFFDVEGGVAVKDIFVFKVDDTLSFFADGGEVYTLTRTGDAPATEYTVNFYTDKDEYSAPYKTITVTEETVIKNDDEFDSVGTPVKANYAFVGWVIAKDDTALENQAADASIAEGTTITVYATWRFDVTIGTEDNAMNFTPSPVYTETLNKGEIVSWTGTMTSAATNNWEAPFIFVYTPGGDTPWGWFRIDWCVSAEENTFNNKFTAVAPIHAVLEAEHWDITKFIGPSWDGMPGCLSEGEIALTVNWTDEDTIYVSYSFYGNGMHKVMTYKIVAADSYSLADSYTVGVGGEKCYIQLTDRAKGYAFAAYNELEEGTSVTLGVAENTGVNDYTFINYIQKGEKIVFEGSTKAPAANSWETNRMWFGSGISNVIFRADNWVDGSTTTDENKTQDVAAEGWHITKTATPSDGSGTWFQTMGDYVSDATLKVTIDWTNEAEIHIVYEYTHATSGKTFKQEYVITSTNGSLAPRYNFALGYCLSSGTLQATEVPER